MATYPSVLLVDDDVIILQLFQSFFTTFNCQVTLAQDADQATSLLAAKDFDLVITDLQMGATSGFEVIRRCKSDYTDIVAFLMTGTHDPNHSEAAYAIGADAVFFKPVSFGAILSKLEDHGIHLDKNDLAKQLSSRTQTCQEALHSARSPVSRTGFGMLAAC